MDARKRAAIYARVSTRRRDKASGEWTQNPAMQLEALREFAARRELEVVAELTDWGVSGTKDHRPELAKLMDLAHKRLVDVVLVYRFDRFARSVRHLVNALHEFEALGINFVSYSENLDTTTPMGRAMFAIMGALAQLERDIIVERTVEGQARARARGKRIGRPPALVDGDRLEELLQKKLSIRTIARELGVGKNVILRALRRAA